MIQSDYDNLRREVLTLLPCCPFRPGHPLQTFASEHQRAFSIQELDLPALKRQPLLVSG